MNETTRHIPILFRPIVDALMEPLRKQSFDGELVWLVDCTLGGGGHTAGFLEAFEKYKLPLRFKILSIDRDGEAIDRAASRFQKEVHQGRLELVHGTFSDLPRLTENREVLGYLADLGISSDQLDAGQRGFSFLNDGPLDMRMDQDHGISCEKFLRDVSEKELERVLKEYGEEPFSRRIASAIVQARRKGEVPTSTRQLSDMIVKAIPAKARHKKAHAATRSFQALRIAVNSEMEHLDLLLKHVITSLRKGGRAAVMSFHSLEDRKIKMIFKESAKQGVLELLSKKPLVADEEEVRRNRRARSAKLRLVEKK